MKCIGKSSGFKTKPSSERKDQKLKTVNYLLDINLMQKSRRNFGMHSRRKHQKNFNYTFQYDQTDICIISLVFYETNEGCHLFFKGYLMKKWRINLIQSVKRDKRSCPYFRVFLLKLMSLAGLILECFLFKLRNPAGLILKYFLFKLMSLAALILECVSF